MHTHLRRNYRAGFIYHFTDKRNLPEIKKAGGLLPRRSLSIIPYIPGGNDWSITADDRFGLDQHVHCCFLPNHPMEYLAHIQGRIDPVWLNISVDVLNNPSVRYTPGVSNQSGMAQYNNHEAIENLDLLPLYRYLDWTVPENAERRGNAEKYEILLPFKIPLSQIGGI
jgi:hypothetical protein